MNQRENLQIVDLCEKVVLCKVCKTNLSDNNNYIFMEKRWNEPEYTDDLCRCKKCNTEFLLRFTIYDHNGHVDSGVLVAKKNNEGLRWVNMLDIPQKNGILQHLKKCKQCRDMIHKKSLHVTFGNNKLISLEKYEK